ncbi:hypothetical protein [Marinobacter nauticus]|uniref:Uncharacterized protein n=1 Tax=Marinobacter nauticus (strain ATCC 700491 / DSM 11845 / VT8) TaxID=351348 RepID=A1U800_MARN8|nr:hypothetical protein [Marinobacter nauticus]ABM21119.1 hypothetical protein Maqu_4268 [Marinobacter nauticus VT8]
MANETVKTAKPTSNWSDRLKQSHEKMASYFATYGEKTGLGGSSLLLMGGGAMMMAAATSSTPTTAALAATASGTAVLAAILNAGGTSITKDMAEKHLGDAEAILDASNSKRVQGATPVTDDPVLSDPSFQKAMATAFQQLQDDPKARVEFNNMIQNSPSARRALMNAQRQIDAAAEMREQANQAPAQADSEDNGPSMTYH